MKKIVTFILITCISSSIVGCVSKTATQNSENKTVAINNIAEKDGTEKLKPLEIIGPATPHTISEFIVECNLPQVPEKIEVFEPNNIRDAEGSINYRPSEESSYASEEALDFEKAAQVAKTFLTEKGVKLPEENLTVSITSSRTSLPDGKVDVYTVSAFVPREINGLRLHDGDINVRISKGYYKIISPKEAVDLIPKYMYAVWGDVLSITGYITSIDIRYFGLTQNNIQPVYVISGYTDKNKKDQIFRVTIPAIR